MHIIRFAKRFLGVVGFIGLIAVSGFFKLSFWVGSQHAFFSATNCVAPLLGCFGGVAGGLLVFALRTLMRLCLGTVSLATFFHGIPYLCASLYWATQSAIIRIGIPLSCMILFWMHPVGFQAGIYACYWIIPVAIAMSAARSLFLRALASTFVAHAVGSVIWLYAVGMESEVWMALLPVVAVERLLFAAGMVVAHSVITAAIRYVNVIRIAHMNGKKSMTVH